MLQTIVQYFRGKPKLKRPSRVQGSEKWGRWGRIFPDKAKSHEPKQYIKLYRQTDRGTDGQTDRRTDKQTDIQKK